MKVQQLKYPFRTITLNNVNAVQIGIERPHNIPIEVPYESFQIPIRITYRNKGIVYKQDLTVTRREILEFGDIGTSFTLEILDSNNRYLIIDLAYETAD